MKLLELAASNLGWSVAAPGGLGGECVDLANLYLIRCLGLAPVRKNAVDWHGPALAGFKWTPNSPLNAPAFGDLVIWGEDARAGTGPNGHIAVCIASDNLHFVSVDQNWPDGAPVALVVHHYAGVLGWQMPV